ncbi:GNAT family N-acetyltransferase [Nonomuraea sp. B5E05]|uniref:GNAT family N-acetyltransferase n=1 Tax=Nonomuraea sp. B5E05 TaxID=3153569 RepID=UPI0032608105
MYVAAALSPRHRIDSFDCGKEELNTWLSKHALHAQSSSTARTFVWTEADQTDVLAYYSLAGHVVEREVLPKKIGRGSPDQIPAVILARLALDERLHGRGLGGVLLVDALARAVEASMNVAARLMVVDAIDESAATFYEKYGFTRIPGTMRLIQKMSSIKASIEDSPSSSETS